jgi:hypothetical protein
MYISYFLLLLQVGSETSYYNDDHETPTYSTRRARFSPIEAVQVLLQADTQPKCLKVPLKVRQNMTFIIDTTKLNRWEDVKSDMNGVFTIGLRAGIWTIELTTDQNVNILAKKKLQPLQKNQLYLRINSKKNVHGLSRSLFHLEDAAGQIVNSACLLQYQLDNHDIDSVEFEVSKHGNRKHGSSSYYPTQKSVLDRMKHELPVKGATSIYHEMLQTKGGAVKIRDPGEIPRGRQQVWQLKANLEKKKRKPRS